MTTKEETKEKGYQINEELTKEQQKRFLELIE